MKMIVYSTFRSLAMVCLTVGYVVLMREAHLKTLAAGLASIPVLLLLTVIVWSIQETKSRIRNLSRLKNQKEVEEIQLLKRQIFALTEAMPHLQTNDQRVVLMILRANLEIRYAQLLGVDSGKYMISKHEQREAVGKI